MFARESGFQVYRYRCRASPELDLQRRRTRRKVPTAPARFAGTHAPWNASRLAPRGRPRASIPSSLQAHLKITSRNGQDRTARVPRVQSRRARAHDKMARWRPVDTAILLSCNRRRRRRRRRGPSTARMMDGWCIRRFHTPDGHTTPHSPRSAPSRPVRRSGLGWGKGACITSRHHIARNWRLLANCTRRRRRRCVAAHCRARRGVCTREQQSHWSVWTRMLHRASSQAGLRERASERGCAGTM